MKKVKVRRVVLYLSPITYLMVVGFLLFNFFTASIHTQHYSAGMAVNVVRTVANQFIDEQIRSVTLQGNGQLYSISRHQPVILHTSDGFSHRLNLISYEQDEDNFNLSFDYGVNLTFSNNRGNLVVSGAMPAEVHNIERLSLPWTIMAGSNLIHNENGYSITIGEDVFYIEHEAGAVAFDLAGGRLNLLTTPNASLSFTANSLGEVQPLSQFIAGLAGYQSTFAQFLSDEQNRAISQLNSRFNNQTHGHTLSSGQAGFNEQALLVHNALTASPLLGQAAAANRSNLTMLSAAYFGQLESANGAHLTHQTQLLQQVRTALAANDGSIFLTANLYNLVLSGSQLTLRNQLATLAARVDTNEDSLITAGKALFLLAAVQTDNRPAERTALNNQLNELLSRVILLNRGLVLYRPALGKIELEAAIRTGYLLINASSISGLNRSAANNERFIGENLITTSLSFAGSNGFVPHYALWEGAGITYSANFFSYEHIAAYLWPSLFMPQVHSQHITMNAGQAVYTLANNVRTTWLSSSAINLELGVTPAHEHYLLFTGLPAIASVALNTANNQLTEVESLTGVSSGWLYNSDERTLYVRLPAGGGRQNLLINFAVNTPAPAATAASSQQVATGGPATTVSPAAAVIAAAEETAPATAEPERLTWAQRRALARQGN